LEVVESIHVLKGAGSADTRSLVVMQGTALLSMAFELSQDEAKARLEAVLDNGKALEVFGAMCLQQGVDEGTVEQLLSEPESVVEHAPLTTTVVAQSSGYLSSIDAFEMAVIARECGAGRFEVDDVLDLAVGFVVHVEQGSFVHKNEPVFTFHHRQTLDETTVARLRSLPQIVTEPVSTASRLLATVHSPSTKP